MTTTRRVPRSTPNANSQQVKKMKMISHISTGISEDRRRYVTAGVI